MVALDLVGLALLGIPLKVLAVQLDHVALRVEHLDMCALDLFVVRVGDVGLGDLDLGQGVLDKKHGVVICIGRLRAGGGHPAMLVNCEGRLSGDGVAVGCDGLLERVGLADLEALDRVPDGALDLLALRRCPLCEDVVLGVDDLDVSALELLVAGDVGL